MDGFNDRTTCPGLNKSDLSISEVILLIQQLVPVLWTKIRLKTQARILMTTVHEAEGASRDREYSLVDSAAASPMQ